LLLEKRGKEVWLYGFIPVFLFMALGGLKDIIWILILSAFGLVLAKIILIYKTNKKNSQ